MEMLMNVTVICIASFRLGRKRPWDTTWSNLELIPKMMYITKSEA